MGIDFLEHLGFRWLFDAAADALLLVDASGKILLSNPAAQQLFGYAVQTLEGQDVEVLVPLRHRSRHRDLRHRYVRQPHRRVAGTGTELSALTRDGREFPVEISLSPLEAEGHRFTLVTVSDITVRKTLERDLLSKRREMDALQKTHVAAQTAAIVAHELNQPLLAIASYGKSALLMLESGRFDPEKLKQAMAGCEQQAQRAGDSIRQLLGFLNMTETPAEVLDLHQEIRSMLEAARAEHHFQVRAVLQLAPSLPQVKANRIHIQKALLNIFHNGIEAMASSAPPSPTLTVRTQFLHDPPRAQVSVSDNGPGFAPQHLTRLFDPFFTTKPGGIGMGLVISRSLVEANHGHLWLESDGPPGARFHMTLPVMT